MATATGLSPEERTTALGMYHFAESYRHGANRIRLSKAKPLMFDAPIRFLYYHSIELYLKSVLRALGLSPVEIKSTYGHQFCKLQAACERNGLDFDDEDIAVIGLVDGSNYWGSRYIETGYVRHATLPALARTSHSLSQNAFAFLRSRRILVRKPVITPSRLRK
ncbi:hypothetical protein I6F09_04880 [Bradyrhizobium sp. IC3195]|uniref:hypothetical protein n=1 Tax=Bradyrhizobium sp. IC3195 TaxID=2793804 RepID=UPI001CD6DC2B|nr:hypothetical protein [Bradyrhizobium sp. IC3195]MCA1467221.1 hypothetical protein [Bradyrhizobium sp. IC3195]